MNQGGQHFFNSMRNSSRVLLPIIAISLGLLLFVDSYATYLWGKTQVTNGSQALELMVGVLLWTMTTTFELMASLLAFRAGTIVYVAAFEAILGVFKRGEFDSSGAFAKVFKEYGGIAWLLVLYFPALAFDIFTDYTTARGSVTVLLAVVMGFSSIFAEQMNVLLWTAWSMAREEAPSSGGGGLPRRG